ncbi:MAG TPA: hypothetical protein VGJ42_03085 [Nitrososphaera sp.]
MIIRNAPATEAIGITAAGRLKSNCANGSPVQVLKENCMGYAFVVAREHGD